MDNNINLYTEMAYDARRALEREQEKLMEKAESTKAYLQILEVFEDMVSEINRLQSLVDDLQQQLDCEKQQRADAVMKLMEMSKLSVGMAKKTSDDSLVKALRTYVNRSKRKTTDKRAFAKTACLEIANANGLDMPEDLKATIEALDDEQVEPRVAVQGDLVLEKKVSKEVAR